MKKLTALCFLILFLSLSSFSQVTVKPVDAIHGKYTVQPALPVDGKVAQGTVLTITAKPDAGYVFDGGYYASPGRWGLMYYESMTPSFKVVVDKDMQIGASFIEKSKVANINVTQDVFYAKPGVKPLKYDVYSPKGAKNLPCIIIIHGGGWTTNTEDIMRGLARELAGSGKYVVFSIDYRWMGKLDGDATDNTMCDLIQDVFGAIAHIMEHAKEYGGDGTRLGVTGDSAGGHLSAVVATMCDKIGDKGFGLTPDVYEFMPSYLPKNKSVSELRTEMMQAIKATAPSYGVFGDKKLSSPLTAKSFKNELQIKAIAPIDNIPDAKDRAVSVLLLRGTKDLLIRDEEVKSYADALVKAGQWVEYIQAGGANHAFFDWKPDEATKQTFAQYGVYYSATMMKFFDSVL
jgi:acetyl esterase